jgi:phosphatidylethanolamine/phosphatidyl-N-methylethanolamine N-methyltransferase
VQHFEFIGAAMRSIRQVGAILPSSRFVATRIASRVTDTTECIIEYGAGNGAVTRELLKKLGKTGVVYAIEMNQRLLPALYKLAESDPRVHVIEGCVQDALIEPNVFDARRADLIVSGIPFSFIQAEDRRFIVARSHELLAPYGRMVVYQHSDLMEKYLLRYFRSVQKSWAWFNFPPYLIMTANA